MAGHKGREALQDGELFYNEFGTLVVHPDRIRERLKQGKRIAEVYDTAYDEIYDENISLRVVQNHARKAVNDFLALWAIPESEVEAFYKKLIDFLKVYENAYEFKQLVDVAPDEEEARKFAARILKDAAPAYNIPSDQVQARFEQAQELQKVYSKTYHKAVTEGYEEAQATEQALERVKRHIKLWQVPENDIGARTSIARAFYYGYDWDMLVTLPWSILESACSSKLDDEYRHKLVELEFFSRKPEYDGAEWAITTNLADFHAYTKTATWKSHIEEVNIKYLLLQETLGTELTEDQITQIQEYRNALAVQAEREAQAVVEQVEETLQTSHEEPVMQESLDDLEPLPLSNGSTPVTHTWVNDEVIAAIGQAIVRYQESSDAQVLAAKDDTIAFLQKLVDALQKQVDELTAWKELAIRDWQADRDDYNALAERYELLEQKYENYKKEIQQKLSTIVTEIA
jgi:hypothetical protein